MYDAVVVGAGPAGNMAAWRLAESGHRVVVLDWRRNIGDKLCTGIVGPECVSRFPPSREHILSDATTATVVSPMGTRYRIVRQHPQAHVLDRARYVASFADRAIQAGAEYRLGTRATAAEVTSGGVVVTAEDEASSRRYQARIVILASGFTSPLTDGVGLGDSRADEYLIGCQAQVETGRLDETEMHLGDRVAPGSFGWLVPVGRGRALAGIVSTKRLSGHMDAFLSALRDGGSVGRVLTPPQRWGIPARPRQRTYAARALLAGDAAGLVKPTTGGGIYYGLLSGELAAEVTGEALEAGDFSERFLKRYEKRWKASFGKELRIGYYARKLYEALDDNQRERLLRVCCEIEGDLVSPSEFSFDWHAGVILKAIRHRDLGPLIRSFGPSVAPHLARLAGARLI